ncbi:hypothetical protein LO80_01455 [Candidatus Francisella endociliophora]|uniref:Gp5/Type VI secretion system Vgr protein OB-fold domain-containing protein n=1 Tax=Candidatus Francisella endociliophora TaxID=653937 RepID=A0A097EMH6_9GAMM|nr:hypothetical protein [Francisella sp. FSC1006]AIT08771.1 hypothetical protein LO80_01455 [Francisella sp. FSC1006]
MATPLTIELFNESINLDLQINDLTFKSAINQPFEVSLRCGVVVDDTLIEKLNGFTDLTLSINGDYGNPTFELELQSFDIEYQPSTDIQTLELVLTDRYSKFRKLQRKGIFYGHNLNDIWLSFYDGFKNRLNRKISEHLYFDNNQDKYPTHPIYVQYNETHWDFLTRSLLEHGVNYNFFASKDGFDFVMYNTNDDISNFVQSDDTDLFEDLYHYNLKLDANIKAKDDVVLGYDIVPEKNGYILNTDIQDFYSAYINNHQQPDIHPKIFIKKINYIHHNPYTPEEYLISSTNLESKFGITKDVKSKFNTLTKSQLDEALANDVNVLNSLDAEQLTAHINDIFLLAGARLDISGDNKLKSREHLVTASIVNIKASKSSDKVIGATPKKDYIVTTTLLSQDTHIDYHEYPAEQPKINSLVGVFPYLAEASTAHDVVDPDDIGNVRVKFPLDYEVCPNNDKDDRYYVPRVSDYGDKNSSHSVQLYRESELNIIFIDGNPNKPIIYGALSHGGTSKQSMQDHHNRHVKEWQQGSAMGYSSDANGTNDIYIKSTHNSGVAWVAQSNHGSDNELNLDQLFASTSNRSDTATGEYQHFYGFDDDTNFSANHHKSIKPKTVVEDVLKNPKQENLHCAVPVENSVFKTYKLNKEEKQKVQQEAKEEEAKLVKGHPTIKLNLFKKDVVIVPSQVATYLVTGKISLEGDISVTDTDEKNIMKNVDFTADKKNNFKVSASQELANGLADIHVEGFDVDSSTGSLSLKSSLGVYDLTIDKSETLPDGTIVITGSISSNNETIDKTYKGYQFDGKLNLGFEIFLKQQKWYERLAKAALYAFVKNYYWQYFMTPEELATILLTGITTVVAPELLPIMGAMGATAIAIEN